MAASIKSILFIAPGSVIHTIKWLNGLVNDDTAVYLVTQHKVLDGLDKRVKVIMLPLSNGLGYIFNSLFLRKTVKRIQPSIIHVHYASGYGTLAWLSGIKPYILSVWGSDVYEFPYQSSIKMWLIKKSLASAQHIASTSYAMADQVKKITPDKKLNISITPFGVDLIRFKNTKTIFTSNAITIGIVKRLEHKYGIDILLHAFAMVKEHMASKKEPTRGLRLHIVGDGSKQDSLEALSQQLGIAQQVKFFGAVSNESVNEYINEMDLFVVPSRIESFGVAAIEAMACERPCVVADTGGLPEVVSYGKVGCVAEYESAVSFANKLIYLIEQQDEAIEMGKNARIEMLKKYSNPAVIDTMKNLYIDFYDKYR